MGKQGLLDYSDHQNSFGDLVESAVLWLFTVIFNILELIRF